MVALVAHPDDAEILFFGTLRRWRDAGAAVTVVIATHGVHGISVTDRDAGIRLDAEHRPAESAAAYAGTEIDVECLGLEDGALQPDRHLVSTIEEVMTRLACTVLLTHAVHTGNDHQDHHAVAKAAVNAAARIPGCTTILHGQPIAAHHSVDGVVLVDITNHIDGKLKALQRHQSQSGRYYLGQPFTRHRSAAPGWAKLPHQAADGRCFEALTPSLMLLANPPERP
ncbi:PIG-L deacetylase family protein [Asanoa iriomotensis]|uniref:PIG-L deacetylase family protein n=1 Tax=Asanoa iriomotensis TaxID=234613 RepID=UPI001941B092|nr:PIG-L family deacetylase [Asanoa iriomotensis]